jgi:predicted dinucleotide-binding enzyme
VPFINGCDDLSVLAASWQHRLDGPKRKGEIVLHHRVGIPLAGDDRDALEIAAGLVRDAGYDPVVVGPLARGKEFAPDTPHYNTGMSGRALRVVLGQTATGGTQ